MSLRFFVKSNHTDLVFSGYLILYFLGITPSSSEISQGLTCYFFPLLWILLIPEKTAGYG